MPRFVSCPFCRSLKFKKKKTDCGADIVQCLVCGFLYVNPQPTVEELDKLYSTEYFAGNGASMQRSLRHRLPVFARGIGIINELRKPGKVLDVGCGNGDFVELAREAGWDASGLDLSEQATSFARNKGLDVVRGTLQTSGFPSESFDVVTLWDVLEHLPDPAGELECVRRVLKPGGFLVVRVPNIGFQLLRVLVQEVVFHSGRATLQADLHLNHFSPTTLRRLLRRRGFEVLREEVGVSEDTVCSPEAPLWLKKAVCRAAEVVRSVTSIHMGPTMVLCGRKVSDNGDRIHQ